MWLFIMKQNTNKRLQIKGRYKHKNLNYKQSKKINLKIYVTIGQKKISYF